MGFISQSTENSPPDLLQLLTKLYSTTSQIQVVWQLCGGEMYSVNWNGSASGVWFNLINLVSKGGSQNVTIEKLIQQAYKDYPNNQDIAALTKTISVDLEARPKKFPSKRKKSASESLDNLILEFRDVIVSGDKYGSVTYLLESLSKQGGETTKQVNLELKYNEIETKWAREMISSEEYISQTDAFITDEVIPYIERLKSGYRQLKEIESSSESLKDRWNALKAKKKAIRTFDDYNVICTLIMRKTSDSKFNNWYETKFKRTRYLSPEIFSSSIDVLKIDEVVQYMVNSLHSIFD